ncbi:MAG: rhodanese-related sulfurtransferase [Kiritimatiellia bacterium]|jgi:rhodanese-related sulfurtransferase
MKPKAPRSVNVAELHEALKNRAVSQLVDVRMGFEFAGGHVPAAVNIPLAQLDSRISELDKEQDLWIICASGNRSSQAATALHAKGFSVVDVAGGTGAWRRAGHAVEPKGSLRTLLLPAAVVLLLGLAPAIPMFSEEPHLFGKLRWVAGGAVGMTGMDWFDLVMHGAPWLWLLWSAGRLARDRMR